jgi:uncharacterized protein
MYVGVLRAVLHIPHARTLKDGRAVLQRLRDRVRARFDVAVAEVEVSEVAARRVLAVSTLGDDGKLVRSVLDKARAVIEQDADAQATDVTIDVFPWKPDGR